MKTTQAVVLLSSIAALAAAAFMTQKTEQQLVVHEWGTFTSLQGSDGVPLKWNPLESSKLPGFVYNWVNPGLGRRPTGMLALGAKNVLVTLQRMETPVVYFYASKETRVDLTVRFPNGGITEWFPQAADVGPCVYPQNPVVTSLDSGLHQCGVPPSFTLDSVFEPKTEKASLIRWPDLDIVPAASHAELEARLKADASGSHYFAARETDSAFVRSRQNGSTNISGEYEKFLFYRGVGNFVAPLHVEMNESTVRLSNIGVEPLGHLFVLGIEGDRGDFLQVDTLKRGEQKSAALNLEKQSRPVAAVRKAIQTAMAQSLVAEGLYPREAAAMIKTWDDSWFAEPGVRVLYILPGKWTDQTLPMAMDPQPQELVRVMVGRAELISTTIETQLARELVEAKADRISAKDDLRKTIGDLGRFAWPAFDRALARADVQPSDRERLRGLFYEVRDSRR